MVRKLGGLMCWAPTIPGAFAFARLRRRVTAWRAEDERPEDELAVARQRRRERAAEPVLVPEPVAA